jgi:hypothetical protein
MRHWATKAGAIVGKIPSRSGLAGGLPPDAALSCSAWRRIDRELSSTSSPLGVSRTPRA